MTEPAERPSVAVVGPGAIGLVVASALIDTGHRPLLAARTPFERIVHTRIRPAADDADATDEALTGDTFRAEAGSRFDLLTDPAVVAEPVDVVFIATKITQTPDAGPWIQALYGPGTVVACVQNGIDHRDRLSTWVPQDAVVPVVVNLPAERQAPGVVTSGGRSNLAVPDDDGGQRVAAALAGSFLPVVPLDAAAFTTASWTKLVVNSAIGILAVLTGAPNGVIADPEARWLFCGLVEEAVAVGRAEGADLPDDLADRLVERILGGAPDHRSSIAVDRAAGRPTEWRARNQIVVDLAARHGIDVPLNRSGTTLIRLGEPPSRG